MEYTVSRLAELAGISPRTLRYYDRLGLLKPARLTEGGYRIYGPEQVRRLQELLIYRQMELPLTEIRRLLDQGRDSVTVLREHLAALERRQARTALLMENVRQLIEERKGGPVMTDKARFEGMKKEMVEKNEISYGGEIRRKYGEEQVNESNSRLMGLSQEQFDDWKALEGEILDALREAVASGDVHGQAAMKLCELHRRWLQVTWPSYSKQAHLALAESYVQDERFAAYYEQAAPGGAAFLLAALQANL